MKPFLRQQLERFPVRLQELDFFLQQPEVVQDMDRFRALTREHAEVSEVAALFGVLHNRRHGVLRETAAAPEVDTGELGLSEIGRAHV